MPTKVRESLAKNLATAREIAARNLEPKGARTQPPKEDKKRLPLEELVRLSGAQHLVRL